MSTAPSRSNKKQAENVPDDWDDDVSEDDAPNKVDSKKIWEEAEKLPAPKAMPVITSSHGAGSSGSFIPPAEAFSKPRQILRRQPTSSSTSSSGGGPDPNNGSSESESNRISLAAREKAYLDARDRIFGSGKPASPSPSNSQQPTDHRTA